MQLFSVFGEILLKDNGIDSKLKETDKNASKLGGTFDGTFSKIGGAALKLGAILGVSLGFKDLFDKASASQQALAQMDSVLKSTGGQAGMTKDALVSLADSQSKVTTYSKGANEATENLLLTFTNIGQKTFPQALTAVNDMSTALGQDTKSSAIQLGKALNDPVKGITALSRVGVSFTQQQKDQIAAMEKAGNVAGAQGVILQELQKEFGGSAEAAGKTFAGQLTILQNQLTSVGVGIVSKLLPPLTELVTNINNHMPQIQAVVTNVIDGIENAVNTLTPIVKDIIKDVLQIANDVFPKMGSSGTSLGTELLELAKGGLTAIKDVLDWFAQHGEATKIILIGIGTAFATWKTITTTINTINNVKSAISTVTTTIGTVKDKIDTARLAFMYFQDGVLSVSTKISNFGSSVLNTLGSGLTKIGGLAKSAGSAMLDFGKAAGTAVINAGKMTIELGKQAIQWTIATAKMAAHKIAMAASTIATNLMSAAQAALNFVMNLNPITLIIIAIAGLVTALVVLYNKNQVFRDFINGMWAGLKQIVGDAIEGIKGFFQGLGEKIEGVGTWIKNTWNNVLSFFAGLPGRFIGFVEGIGTAIQNGFNNAISFITSLPGKALKWGEDFIDGLINGIKSKIGDIGSAVSGIADKITSFLHFSVPDEGSLTDYETWMPDFMSGLAKGINNNKNLVTNAVKGLSTDMSVGMKLNTAVMANKLNISDAQTRNQGNNKSVDTTSKRPVLWQVVLPNLKVLAELLLDDIDTLKDQKFVLQTRRAGGVS